MSPRVFTAAFSIYGARLVLVARTEPSANVAPSVQDVSSRSRRDQYRMESARSSMPLLSDSRAQRSRSSSHPARCETDRSRRAIAPSPFRRGRVAARSRGPEHPPRHVQNCRPELLRLREDVAHEPPARGVSTSSVLHAMPSSRTAVQRFASGLRVRPDARGTRSVCGSWVSWL